jgi:hypothetical protein
MCRAGCKSVAGSSVDRRTPPHSAGRAAVAKSARLRSPSTSQLRAMRVRACFSGSTPSARVRNFLEIGVAHGPLHATDHVLNEFLEASAVLQHDRGADLLLLQSWPGHGRVLLFARQCIIAPRTLFRRIQRRLPERARIASPFCTVSIELALPFRQFRRQCPDLSGYILRRAVDTAAP